MARLGLPYTRVIQQFVHGLLVEVLRFFGLVDSGDKIVCFMLLPTARIGRLSLLVARILFVLVLLVLASDTVDTGLAGSMLISNLEALLCGKLQVVVAPTNLMNQCITP